MRIQRSIRLSPEADEALRVMAERTERSVSQLIEMAVRSQYVASAGSRSMDGRESAETKAAREEGAVFPVVAENLAETPEGHVVRADPEKPASYVQERPAARPQRHEFASGEEWQAAVRAWKGK